MSATRPICRRCHRLRQTNPAGYCGSCSRELVALERRKPVVDEATAVLAPSLAPPTEPPPPATDTTPPPPPIPPDNRMFVLPEIDEGERPEFG